MSDIMLDIIKRWLTDSVSTSTGSGPPGEVFSAYESLVNERNAAKTRAAELEADRDVLVKGVLAAEKHLIPQQYPGGPTELSCTEESEQANVIFNAALELAVFEEEVMTPKRPRHEETT